MSVRINYDLVARRAGVSKATVHRALTNHSIQVATRERVLAAAAELGYQPHPMVQALMTQVRSGHVPNYTGTLAYISAFDAKSYNPLPLTSQRFMKGALSRARELGYGLDVMQPIEENIGPDRLAQILKGRGIVGAVILACNFSQSGRMELIGRESLPFPPEEFACVSLGGKYDEPNLNFAVADQYAAGRMMARHLEDLGYQRPVLMIGDFVDGVTESRFQAGFLSRTRFHRGVQRAPVVIMDQTTVIDKKNRPTKLDKKFIDWFLGYGADVVVASFPETLPWLRGLGLEVPRDIGFACFDCDPEVGNISGIDQRHELVGAAAVDLLVQQINLNQRGEPAFTKGSEIEGVWVPGKTLQPVGGIETADFDSRGVT